MMSPGPGSSHHGPSSSLRVGAKARLEERRARLRMMLKLWPGSVRVSVCAAGLWLLALIGPGAWFMAVAGTLVVVGFGFLRRGHQLGVLLIMFGCLATLQTGIATTLRGPEEPTSVSGVVIGHSQPGPSGWTKLTVLSRTGPTEVLSPSLPPAGARVTVTTERLGDIRSSREHPGVLQEPNALWRFRQQMRDGLREDSLASGHSGGRLLPGLVVGDTEPQDARMIEDMRTVSLSHISAVSGTNITIVSLGAGSLAGLCRAGPRTRVSVGVLACLFYVFIVGFEPSAIRAAGMALVVALVFLRGGGISPVAVIAATVSVLLSLIPQLGTSVGFALSVISTAAILFVIPVVMKYLGVRLSIVPTVLLSALAVPLVAQIACTPILVAIDPRVGVWSVAANALAAPTVLPATVLGFISLLCGGLGLLGLPTMSWLAEFSAWVGSLCAWWITQVARLCARLPGAGLDWPEPPWGTLIAIALVLLLALGFLLLLRKRAWAVPVLVLCIALTAVVIVVHRTKPPGADWLVTICDVGQGSATLIRTGEGRGLVVDTGKEPGPIDTCLDDSGIEEFDLLISHFDADHSAGFEGALWDRTVSGLRFTPNAVDSEPAQGMGTRTGMVASTLARGESIEEGAIDVEVLWPPDRTSGSRSRASPGAEGTPADDSSAGQEESAERNEDSLVLRVEHAGLSYLVPGDIGEEEQYVLAQGLRAVDVLIAPHHGSGDLSEDFFRAAAPRLGVVSVGENDYGHPSARAMRAFGPIPVLRTDQCGTIAIYAEARFTTGRECSNRDGAGTR